ncbi:fungal-specific transcription factor domain-containing protein [Lentinula raphanica]|nr:fungal-specific transcription factor domain-containing protein [Lentinula raphanica]
MFAVDEDSEPQAGHKKPRLPNACTHCRSKKIKCDSAIMPNNICSNCIAYDIECTREPMKKRRPRIGPSPRSIHTTVDAILSTRRRFEVPKDPAIVKGILVDLANYVRVLEEDIARLRQELGQKSPSAQDDSSLVLSQPHSQRETFQSVHDLSDADDPVDELTRDFKVFGYYDNSIRHYGATSTRHFIESALDVKKEYTSDARLVDIHTSFKRREFWSIQPWQKIKSDNPPPFEFPPGDLMTELIELYFTQSNPYLPILYRPSFLQSMSEGVHLRDRYFGALVLAVCALGARFSDDPRVLEDYTTSKHSSGWKWIHQIPPMKQSFDEPPSLHEVQFYTVYIMFMSSTTTPEACWVIISTGIRLLQDVGAHRRQVTNTKPSVETESWKRVFWLLYSVDILTSTLLGRPRAMSQNDCDADLPIDCDDDCWEQPDPHLVFQQPTGKPSSMAYWICFLKLMNIADLMLHTIHSVKQSDIWSAAFGLSKQERNEKIISEIDSLLNKWVDEIPYHLKWDPDREDILHFDQSVLLYTTYYAIQILAHRPFIPGSGENSQSSIPSLAICANAARFCIHIVQVQQQRKTGVFFVPSVMFSLFNAAIVLLVNTWMGKQLMGAALNISKDLAEVHWVISTLHLYEDRWDQAGRLADVLDEVVSISHFDYPSGQPEQSSSRKRLRVEENPDNFLSFGASTPALNEGSSGITTTTPSVSVDGGSNHPMGLETLGGLQHPLNTNKLRTFPVYEPLQDWSVYQDAHDPTSSWAMTNDNPLGPYATASQSAMDFTEGSPGMSGPYEQSLGGETYNYNPTQIDSEEWASYMAAIDEILQAANSRGV